MIECPSGECLLLEALQPAPVRAQPRGEDLDGHIAGQPRVTCAPDLTHPARTQAQDDLVGSEADSRSEGRS